MVKVYRPDGVEEEMDTVDARECVQHCGYSYEPVVAEEPVEGSGKPGKKTPIVPAEA